MWRVSNRGGESLPVTPSADGTDSTHSGSPFVQDVIHGTAADHHGHDASVRPCGASHVDTPARPRRSAQLSDAPLPRPMGVYTGLIQVRAGEGTVLSGGRRGQKSRSGFRRRAIMSGSWSSPVKSSSSSRGAHPAPAWAPVPSRDGWCADGWKARVKTAETARTAVNKPDLGKAPRALSYRSGNLKES